MAGENPIVSQAAKKGGRRRRIVIGIFAAPLLLAVVLLAILATTGLPLTPVARIALKRADLAPLDVSVDSLCLRWRLPGTLRFTVREIRGEIHGGDPVAEVAGATIDFPIVRRMGRRVLASDVSVFGVQLWLRTQPGGGFSSPISSLGSGAHAAGIPRTRRRRGAAWTVPTPRLWRP